LKKTQQTLIVLGIFLLFFAAEAEPDERISVRGYYKNFSILFMLPAYKLQDAAVNDPDMGAVNNRIRLKLDLHPANNLSLYLAYDLSPRIQDTRLFENDALFAEFTPLEYRVKDFRDRLYPEPDAPVSSFGLFHNLDRFFITVQTKYADIFVGRQAIAWGSARVINPTDIIAPFAFNELDKEERSGVDAVRIRVPLGMMDELDVGFVAGKNFEAERNAFFLRGKTYLFQTDISALLLGFRKHLLIGLDIARSIGGAGFWIESAYVIPGFFRRQNNPDEKNTLRTTLGLDYNLNSKTYGFIEYHFNSAGRNQPERYQDLFKTYPYQDGSVYLMGKHYLNFGSTYQLSPLMPLTGLLILNLSDRSLVFSPVLEYNIAENIYLSAGAYIGLGKKPELILGPLVSPPLLTRSEFGTYPDMIFTSFRIYF
jgi:hypothetical protein